MTDIESADGRKLMVQEFLAGPEAVILLLGTVMLVFWVAGIALLWQLNNSLWLDMLTVSFATLLVGKPAAIAQASQAGLHPVLIVFLATYVDAVTVYVAYPVLVFSYRHLIEIRLLGKYMRRVIKSAQRSVDRFSGCKVAGVFAFVWVPFMMTGVLIGGVLGYLLGLKHWVSMVTVTVSAMVASICWVYAYDRIFGQLARINPGIPGIATALIIAGIVARRIIIVRRARQRVAADETTTNH